MVLVSMGSARRSLRKLAGSPQRTEIHSHPTARSLRHGGCDQDRMLESRQRPLFLHVQRKEIQWCRLLHRPTLRELQTRQSDKGLFLDRITGRESRVRAMGGPLERRDSHSAGLHGLPYNYPSEFETKEAQSLILAALTRATGVCRRSPRGRSTAKWNGRRSCSAATPPPAWSGFRRRSTSRNESTSVAVAAAPNPCWLEWAG